MGLEKLKNNFTFVPAYGLNPGFLEKFNDKFTCSWWEPNSIIKHPFVLVSYWYGKSVDLRKDFKIDDDVFLLGDSAGFQVVSQIGYDWIHPLTVLRWAEEQKIDLQISLDRPPYIMATSSGKSDRTGGKDFGKIFRGVKWEKAKETTAKNAEKMFEESNGVTISAVIQGNTLDTVRDWFNRLTKNHTFNAYSLSVKPAYSPQQMALYAGFAYEYMKDKPLHFLQVGNSGCFAILSYFSKMYKGKITSDSASYAQGAINRIYWLPRSNRITRIRLGLKEQHKLTRLPCNCLVCQNTSVKEILDENRRTQGGVKISLHNLWWTLDLIKYQEILMEDKEVFKWYLNAYFPKKYWKAIEFLDLVKEIGFEEAYRKMYVPTSSLRSFV